MNGSTFEFVERLSPSRLDVLEISGAGWSDMSFKSYQRAGYPDFDICVDRLPRAFDLIIAEQVLEHVRRPDRAAQNILAMLREGGTFLVTTPFLIRYHPEPLDLWRWTAEGLRCVLEDAGFDSVDVRAWGNRACAVANLDNWPIYDAHRHSLENEPDVPLVVWAFAKRLK